MNTQHQNESYLKETGLHALNGDKPYKIIHVPETMQKIQFLGEM